MGGRGPTRAGEAAFARNEQDGAYGISSRGFIRPFPGNEPVHPFTRSPVHPFTRSPQNPLPPPPPDPPPLDPPPPLPDELGLDDMVLPAVLVMVLMRVVKSVARKWP